MADPRLVRHFLRRFVENDLVSPDADRHEVIAVTLAALTMGSLFATVLISTRYLFHPVQSRSWTALVSLEDTFVWCGLSMLIMALVALAAWDALTLDARDTAVLRALPVRRSTVVGAQLAALACWSAMLIGCINTVPTVLAPFVRVSGLPIRLPGILRLMAAHGIATMASGILGFMAVFALRETLRAVLPAAWFERAAPAVQGTAVAVLATALLVLPALSGQVGARFLRESPASVPPPMWFVGLHEVVAGDALVGLPPTMPPPDAPSAEALRASEAQFTARYQQHVPALRAMAGAAMRALGAMCLVAAFTWAWNSRRWPPLAAPAARGTVVARLWHVLDAAFARDALARAGFVFARHVLARSAAHRVRLALALGAVVAMVALELRGRALDGSAIERLPASLLAIQTLAVAIVMAGYRVVTRLPANLAAGVAFDIAGLDNARPFVDGVKRAGIVLVGAPLLLSLGVFHTWAGGERFALAHGCIGMLVLLLCAEFAFVGTPGLPFVTPVPPAEQIAAKGALSAVAAMVLAAAIANVERAALDSPGLLVGLAGTLASVWLGVVMFGRRETSTPPFSVSPLSDSPRALGLAE